MKQIGYGDRLISVQLPDIGMAGRSFRAGKNTVRDISVGRLEGPMGWYLTAQVQFEDSSPDIVMPLHMVEQFEIQFGD